MRNTEKGFMRGKKGGGRRNEGLGEGWRKKEWGTRRMEEEGVRNREDGGGWMRDKKERGRMNEGQRGWGKEVEVYGGRRKDLWGTKRIEGREWGTGSTVQREEK
jgi:hypothetical protein